MKIGKLDPNNLFDKSKDKQNEEIREKDMYNNIVIGKLSTKNLFESQTKELDKQSVQVGKIQTKVIKLLCSMNMNQVILQEIFAENETYYAKPCVAVGKLNVKESDFFDKSNDEDKPVVQIGKLNKKDLFFSESDESGNTLVRHP